MKRDEVNGACPQQLDIEREREQLVRICARILHNPEAAEDLAQETLIVAMLRANTRYSSYSRMAWLTGIARNLSLRWMRKQSREIARTVLLESCQADLPDTFDPEKAIEYEELVELLKRALDSLPEETRRVVVERYLEERSQAEVANRLGINEGTVATRLHRGKLALRQLLSVNLREEMSSHRPLDQDRHEWTILAGSRSYRARLAQLLAKAKGLYVPAPVPAQALISVRAQYVYPERLPVSGHPYTARTCR